MNPEDMTLRFPSWEQVGLKRPDAWGMRKRLVLSEQEIREFEEFLAALPDVRDSDESAA